MSIRLEIFLIGVGEDVLVAFHLLNKLVSPLLASKIMELQVPMIYLGGVELYGEIKSDKKLIVWVPVDVLNQITAHAHRFLLQYKLETCGPIQKIHNFISRWLFLITNRECDWVIHDHLPRYFLSLSQWQELYEHDSRIFPAEPFYFWATETWPGCTSFCYPTTNCIKSVQALAWSDAIIASKKIVINPSSSPVTTFTTTMPTDTPTTTTSTTKSNLFTISQLASDGFDVDLISELDFITTQDHEAKQQAAMPRMRTALISMGAFKDEKLYGEFLDKKLVLWLSRNLYSRVVRHIIDCITLELQKSLLTNPRSAVIIRDFISSLQCANIVTNFISTWLKTVAKQECTWILKDQIPNKFVKLSPPNTPS